MDRFKDAILLVLLSTLLLAAGWPSVNSTVPGSNGECLINSSGSVGAASCGAGGGGPSDATYITQTANGTLSAEQALSSLSTGLMNVTTTTGQVTSFAPTDDNMLVGNGTVWQLKAIPDCDDATGHHLNYDTGTNAFSCGTSGNAALGNCALGTVNTNQTLDGSTPCTTWSMTLSGAITLDVSNLVTGQDYIIDIIENGTGTYAVTASANWVGFPSLYTVAGTRNKITFFYDGSKARVTTSNNDSGVTVIGTAGAPSSNPPAGFMFCWPDSTDKTVHCLNDAGTRSGHAVVVAATASNWLRSFANDGTFTKSQPAFTDISGIATAAQLPGTGNGAKAVTGTTSHTSGVCAEWDANGNAVDAVSGAACGAGGSGATAGSPLFVQVASTSAITSGTETTLINSTGAAGTLTIPAGWFSSAGTVMDIHFAGQYTTAGSPGTLNFKLTMTNPTPTTTTVGQTGTFTPLNSVTNGVYSARIRLVARTVGASGTVFISEITPFTGTTLTPGEVIFSNPTLGTAVTIDTTVAQILNLTATWGTAATNSITGHTFEAVGPGSSVSSVNGKTGAVTIPVPMGGTMAGLTLTTGQNHFGTHASITTNATENLRQYVLGVAIKAANFCVTTITTHGAGGTLVFTFRTNSGAGTQTVQWAASEAATTKCDTTRTDNVAANTPMGWNVVNNSSGNSAQIGSVTWTVGPQ